MITGIFELKIICIIGIYERERKKEQILLVDVEFESKEIIDYDFVALALKELARKKKYKYLETFAEDAIEMLFAKWPITYAKIKIKKPGALKDAKYAFVQLSKP